MLRGDDLVTEIPADRWDAEEYYDPEQGVPGRSVSRWGGFLDDVGGFDAAFFGFGEREATAIDPQHRLLLETSWEAMEHAGLDPASLAGSLTGVFVGSVSRRLHWWSPADVGALPRRVRLHRHPVQHGVRADRLRIGRCAVRRSRSTPHVRPVCSRCTWRVAACTRARATWPWPAAATVMLDSPTVDVVGVGAGHALSDGALPRVRRRRGRVRASEGCAVVLLKRLPDALRDGDRILAVVRGTAANQDGHTANIATPSLDAQAEVYRAALAEAGVDAGHGRHGGGARNRYPGR